MDRFFSILLDLYLNITVHTQSSEFVLRRLRAADRMPKSITNQPEPLVCFVVVVFCLFVCFHFDAYGFM